MNSLNPNFQKKYKLVQKQIYSDKLYEVKIVGKPGLPQALKTLKNLHQNTNGLYKYEGHFDDERFEKLLLKTSNELIEKNLIRFIVIKVSDKIIASGIFYKLKNKYYTYLSGFENVSDHNNINPETIFNFSIIDNAISNNIETIEHLNGTGDLLIVSKNIYGVLISISHNKSIVKSWLIKAVKIQHALKTRFSLEISVIKLLLTQNSTISFLPAYFKIVINRLKKSTVSKNIRLGQNKVTNNNLTSIYNLIKWNKVNVDDINANIEIQNEEYIEQNEEVEV